MLTGTTGNLAPRAAQLYRETDATQFDGSEL